MKICIIYVLYMYYICIMYVKSIQMLGFAVFFFARGDFYIRTLGFSAPAAIFT